MNVSHNLKKIIALILGIIFLFFSNGRWFFPLAAWLYPLFMLYFTRRTKPIAGYLAVMAAAAVCCQISFWKFSSSDPQNPLFYLPALMGIIIAFPFLLDRLLHNKFNGIFATLVFPFAYTTVDFIYGSLSPFGSTGVLGYSQYGILPLIQIVSITGIWGLTFLITWFGSFVNWVIAKMSNLQKIKKASLIYSAVMILVLLYGSVRLIIPEPEGTVKISGIHVYDLRAAEGQELWAAADNDWEKYREMCTSITDRLFEATVREARVGSKIIEWSEVSPPVAKEDEASFVDRASRISSEEKIYLVVSPYVDHKNPEEKDENKLMIFDPSGKVILSHYKYGGNFIEGIVKGDEIIRTALTPYGNLSGVICWDQDFPNTIRQAGQKGVDIMLAPTADWAEIDPIHTVVGVFRSIENGYSLVRESIDGLSIITDSKGRTLASMDHFTSSEWTMSAQVPIKGTFTLYPYIGDLFGWLSITGLVIIFTYQALKAHSKKAAHTSINS